MLASQNELAPRKRRNEQKTIHKEYAHPIAQTSPLWIVAVQSLFGIWLGLALSYAHKLALMWLNKIANVILKTSEYEAKSFTFLSGIIANGGKCL